MTAHETLPHLKETNNVNMPNFMTLHQLISDIPETYPIKN